MSEAGEIATFSYKPLYLQVKDSLIRRLIDGIWQPGQLIPSEMELAREVGVSQGTIRKALDAMTAESMLVRRQGRGTFVAEPEESRLLFRFFRLSADDGARAFPESRIISRTDGAASRDAGLRLGLAAGAELWRIERVRTLDGSPMIVETIELPKDRFPGFAQVVDIPNNVYRLYSENWGITIGRASERLRAVAADARDVAELRCAPAAPLLEISRVAYDLENRPVELRVSRCLTEGFHYSSELG
ncbi:MAG: GntR family transcriptional regulator [Mesorhizobium sp.]|nr:GntR family transcriptional regulator [Mesorhizobium sp.]